MASIAELESRLYQLRREMDSQQRQAAAIAEQTEQKYAQALRNVRAQAQNVIEADRQQTKERYEELLNLTVDENEKKINEYYAQTKESYENVRRELDEAIAREQKQINAAADAQKAFEQEYREKKEQAAKKAEKALSETEKKLSQLTGDFPCEWFMPGRETLYRQQIRDAAGLVESGIYEAAIGICDNLMLSFDLDRLNMEQLLRKWKRYFSVLNSIIDSEHSFVCSGCRNLNSDGFSREFLDYENIHDMMISEEYLKEWMEEGYFKLIDLHYRDFDYIRGVCANVEISDGIPTTESLVASMKKNPAISEGYTIERLYDAAKNAASRFDEAKSFSAVMKSRLRAYCQRLEMLGMLDDIMEQCGMEREPENVYFLGGSKKEALIASYGDFAGITDIELQIVPEYNIAEKKWYNCVGYNIDSDGDTYELDRTLYELLHENFDDYDVLIYRDDPRRRNYTPEERSRAYGADFRQRLNGHS